MEAPPPPPLPPAAVAVLMDDVLLPSILKWLFPEDLVRAALACHRWRRAAAVAIPRAPPLLGYFFHPEKTRSSPAMSWAEHPAVFVPRDASSPRLSLALAPDDPRDLSIYDIHLGLVLLLPSERPQMLPPSILVLDPASRRRALLPPPPRDALADDQWHQTRRIIGAAVLSREHPSKIISQIVCVTLDDDRPRAWLAFVRDNECIWRALPRSNQPMDQFNSSSSFDKRCVRLEANIHWRIYNSGRLLALDPSTLEFCIVEDARLRVASAEEMTELTDHRSIFPYLLCWPPAFLNALELQGVTWTEKIMNLVRIAVYNICYIRRLFAEKFFCDMFMQPTGMQIKNLIPMDDESQRFMDWIEKGVYDALLKRFLRTILFCVYEESGPLIEEYCLSFSYGEDIVMDLRLIGYAESIWTLKSNAVESFPSQMWSSAYSMFQKLVSLMSTWKQIPEERIIVMKLLYYDDVTPPNYEPPFFQCFDEMRRSSYQHVPTTLQDITRDVASLPSYDVKSVLSSDCCPVNKDLDLDLDSEIRQGYLYCITKKKVIFYFDSGASYHICGDMEIMKNLRELPAEEWLTIYDADNKQLRLKIVGEVMYEQIKLSPVYYHKDLNYNIISIGMLDDGNTLIYSGDNTIKIFDLNEGVMIGEGCLHKKRNEYIALSITSTMEASQVDTATESAVNIEEKNLWIIDSLCGNHMTGNRKILSDRRSERQTFTTPNDSIQSLEIGNVRNSTVTLFNVLYCPGIRNNIMSEGQLDRDGYSCTRVAHKCMVQRRATQDTVGLAEQDENMMYYVDHCHCVRDPSQDDAAKNLKRQMQYEPSRSNSRKWIRYQMQYEPSRSNSRKRIR